MDGLDDYWVGDIYDNRADAISAVEAGKLIYEYGYIGKLKGDIES